MTKKKWRLIFCKQIRDATGLSLPVAARLAKGVERSGAYGFALDHKDAPSGSTVRLAAESIKMRSVDTGCSHCGWRIDAIWAKGKKGSFYFEGLPKPEDEDSPS